MTRIAIAVLAWALSWTDGSAAPLQPAWARVLSPPDGVAESRAAAAWRGGVVVTGLIWASEAARQRGPGKGWIAMVDRDDALWLAGHEAGNGFVGRLAATGALDLRHSIDRGRDEQVAGALAATDGGLAVLEQSGVDEQFLARDAVVALSSIGAAGDIVARRFSTPGRAGAVLNARDGLALLVDVGQGVDQQLRFIALDPQWRQVREAEVARLTFALQPSRMAGLPDDRYLVVASDAGRLLCWWLDGAGQTRAACPAPTGAHFLDATVVAERDALVVATRLTLTPSGDSKRELYVAKCLVGRE